MTLVWELRFRSLLIGLFRPHFSALRGRLFGTGCALFRRHGLKTALAADLPTLAARLPKEIQDVLRHLFLSHLNSLKAIRANPSLQLKAY